MDVTSGEIEGTMDQGASDVSGSMRWIRLQAMDVTTAENERAMDQATSYGSGSNRRSDNYVLLIFISKNDTI